MRIEALFAVGLFLTVTIPAQGQTCSNLTAAATNNGPTCSGAPVTLSASTNAANPSFHWQCLHSCGGPAPGVNYDVQNFTTANTGVTWEVVVTDNATGCSTTAVTTPQVDSRPRIAAPLSWCAGNGDITAHIDNNDPSSPFTNITWYVRNGVITTGQGTNSITVHPNSQYPNNVEVGYDISATSAHGCSFPQTGYFDTGTSVSPEQPLFELQAPSNSCGRQFQATLVPTVQVYSVDWSATNATLVYCPGAYTMCFHPNGPGPATISATYTTMSDPGCPRTVSRTISAGRQPTATINPGVIAVCAGQDAVIPITLTGTAPFSIQWADGTIQSGIGDTFVTRTVEPLKDATFTILSVTDANCTGDTPATVSVQVHDHPLITRNPHDTVVAPNSSATLVVEATGDELSFRWYQGTRGDTSHPMSSSLTGTLVTPPIDKTTSYWVRVMNACGTVDSAAATVAPSTGARRRSSRH